MDLSEEEKTRSRKLARGFMIDLIRAACRNDLTRMRTLCDDAINKAEEYKHYPHYLIALVRAPYSMHEDIPNYYENCKKIREIMVATYGEEKTQSFLVGINLPT